MLEKKIQEVHSVILNGEYIQEELNREVQKLALKQKVPGFRLGMVPLNIVFNMHENQIISSTLDQVLRKKISEIPEFKESLKYSFHFPDPVNVKLGVVSDIPVEITFAYPSQFPEIQWSDVVLPVLEDTIPEDEVRAFVDRYIKQFSRCEPLENPRPSQLGDVLSVRVLVKTDKEERTSTFRLPLVKDELPEEVEIDDFIGVEPGHSVSQRFKMPHFFSSIPLAGKKVMVSLLVEDVQRNVPCALDNESAQYIANCDVETLVERGRLFLKKCIQDYSYKIQTEYLEMKIFNLHDIPVASLCVEDEIASLKKQYKDDSAFNTLIPENQRENWFQEIARCLLLKKMFIKDYALKHPECCTYTSQDVLGVLEAYANATRSSIETIMRRYLDDHEFRESIQYLIQNNKVMTDVIKNCSIQAVTSIVPSPWEHTSLNQKKYGELSEKILENVCVSTYIKEMSVQNVTFPELPDDTNSNITKYIEEDKEEDLVLEKNSEIRDNLILAPENDEFSFPAQVENKVQNDQEGDANILRSESVDTMK